MEDVGRGAQHLLEEYALGLRVAHALPGVQHHHRRLCACSCCGTAAATADSSMDAHIGRGWSL